MNNKGSITVGTILAIAIGLQLFTMGMQALHDKEVEHTPVEQGADQ